MRSCTSLHQNLLSNTLTVTRNMNFTLSLFIEINSISLIRNYYQKNALCLSVNVFSAKVLIGDTIFTSPTGEETAILRGHPSVCWKLKISWKAVVFTNKVGKNSRYFVGVFNKTIIPLSLVGYEMIIANSCPTCTRGILLIDTMS